jgi:hypothetical protein
MICTIWKAGVKSLFGSVCHEFLLKAAADAESCCALLMEASEMNFFWKPLSMLLSFLWKAGVRALFGSHCALDNLLDEKLLCVIDGSVCTEFLLEAAVDAENFGAAVQDRARTATA